jgi:hypothetical protein
MTGASSTGEKLRRSFAALDGHEHVGECPTAETIWDAVHARLAVDEASGVVDHIAGCPSCAADWRIAMRSDQRVAPSAVAATSPRHTTLRWTALATAATVILAALLVTVIRYRDAGTPVYRTGDETRIESLVPEDQVLSRDSAILRWSPVGEDALYSIEVGTLGLVPLASAHDLKETEFTVPREALLSVGAGESIVWQIEASLPDGRHVASEAFISRIE